MNVSTKVHDNPSESLTHKAKLLHQRKSWGITRVWRLHLLGTMNVYTVYHGNLFNFYWDKSWTNQIDQPSKQATLPCFKPWRKKMYRWSKTRKANIFGNFTLQRTKFIISHTLCSIWVLVWFALMLLCICVNSPIQHSSRAQGEVLTTSGGSTPTLRHNTSATLTVFIWRRRQTTSLSSHPLSMLQSKQTTGLNLNNSKPH